MLAVEVHVLVATHLQRLEHWELVEYVCAPHEHTTSYPQAGDDAAWYRDASLRPDGLEGGVRI